MNKIRIFVPKKFTKSNLLVDLISLCTKVNINEAQSILKSVDNSPKPFTFDIPFDVRLEDYAKFNTIFNKLLNGSHIAWRILPEDTESITFPDKLEIDSNMELGIMSEYILVKRTTLTALLKEHNEIVELTYRLQNLYSK